MLLQDTVGVYPKAFPDNLCDRILKLYDNPFIEQLHYEGANGAGVVRDIKNSKDFNLLRAGDTVPEAKAISDAVCTIFNTYMQQYVNSFPHQDIFPGMKNFSSPTTFEILQVQRYAKGSGHYNTWHHESGTFKMSRRYFALLVYLNDVESGGETEMLYTNQKIKPEKGKLLLHPAGFPYIHKGNIPLSSDKTILISWLSFVKDSE
jgi:hypothetical protein